jgi:hypothetical protein
MPISMGLDFQYRPSDTFGIHVTLITALLYKTLTSPTVKYLKLININILFRPKRDEVTGGWRKLQNEELHGLYTSLSIFRVIRARRMRRASWRSWGR